MSSLTSSVSGVLRNSSAVPLRQCSRNRLTVLRDRMCGVAIHLERRGRGLRSSGVCLTGSLTSVSRRVEAPLASVGLLMGFLSRPGVASSEEVRLARRLCDLLSHVS